MVLSEIVGDLNGELIKEDVVARSGRAASKKLKAMFVGLEVLKIKTRPIKLDPRDIETLMNMEYVGKDSKLVIETILEEVE